MGLINGVEDGEFKGEPFGAGGLRLLNRLVIGRVPGNHTSYSYSLLAADS